MERDRGDHEREAYFIIFEWCRWYDNGPSLPISGGDWHREETLITGEHPVIWLLRQRHRHGDRRDIAPAQKDWQEYRVLFFAEIPLEIYERCKDDFE